jgi:hypothetical protein
LFLALSSYLALSVAANWNAWSGGASRKLPIAGGDAAILVWSFAWVAHAIAHGQNVLHTNGLNYPVGINLVDNTTALLLGAVLAPITWLFGPVVTFNLVGTLSFFASACAAYALVCRWTSWRPAAFIAGLVYGFSPFMIGTGWGHLFLMFSPFPPLIVLCLGELLVGQPVRKLPWATALGCLVAAQFFVSSEMLALTAELCAIGMVVLALLHRDQVMARARDAVTALAAATTVATALLAYPVWYALFGPEHVRVISPAEAYSADLLGAVVPTSNQLVRTARLRDLGDKFSGGAIHLHGHVYLLTNGSYLGVPLVVLCGWIVWRYRHLSLIRFLTIMSAVAFVGSLGPTLIVDHRVTHVPLPGRITQQLPLLKAIFPYRYDLFVALGVSFLLGVGLDRLHKDLGSRTRHQGTFESVFAGLIILVLIPLLPSVPYSVMRVAVPQYFRSSDEREVRENSVLVSYPFPGPFSTDAMLWQADAHLRYLMAGGYMFAQAKGGGVVGSDSPSVTHSYLDAAYLGKPTPPLSPILAWLVVGDLKSWHAETVLVELSAPGSEMAVKFFTYILGRLPAIEHDVAVWPHLPYAQGVPSSVPD